MFTKFFCLDCEESFQDAMGENQNCPFCASPNIMEDKMIDNKDNDLDGHFEGDMFYRKHDNSVGDD